MFTGPVDKVPHNQEVARHVHVADTVQFLVHALAHIGFVGRELKVLFRETPLEALITKMRDVDIGIATRLAPAANALVPSFLIVFVKEFRLRQAFNFGLVFVGQGVFGNSLVCAIGRRHLFLFVLDDALDFAFTYDRIFRVVFRLHNRLDVLVFIGGQEIFRNLKAGPEFIADTGLDRVIASFCNLHRIFDGPRNMSEHFHHFGFATEIEFTVIWEMFVIETIERLFQGNATQNLVRFGIFGLNVMDIAYGNNFAPQLASQLDIVVVQQLLPLNAIVAHRNVQMVMVKNLVEGFHVFTGNAVAPSSYILTILAKKIARNGDNAFLVLLDDRKRNRGNFCPAIAVFVTVTHDAEQVIVALFVFDQKRKAFKCNRILLVRARGIHINMAAVNRLYRRKALFFAGLVQVFSAGLDFKNAEHSRMVGKRYSRSVFVAGSGQDVIKTGGSL